MEFSQQINRIKQKLMRAKKTDVNFEVFGASSHKYILNKTLTLEEIEEFEKEYLIKLPECYRIFLLEIGNGGAGAFYGIYNLGKNIYNFVYQESKELFRKDCIITPDLSNNNWNKLKEKIIDDNISDEEYDANILKIHTGLLPLGTQGCGSYHGLILNGKYKGKVVNINMEYPEQPIFTFENNFLDWYERWLDEIISGILITSLPIWFGYTMGGTDKELIEFFKKNSDIQKKKDALSGLLKKKSVTKEVLKEIEKEYLNSKDELKLGLLQALTKFDYSVAKSYLMENTEENLLRVFQCIYWYAKENCYEWIDFIKQNIEKIRDRETLNFCIYLLRESNYDYGDLIKCFTDKKYEENMRTSAIYGISQLKNKHKYLDIFIKGLNDDSEKIILESLKALSNIKDRKLLKYYKELAKRFSKEQEYIFLNLKHNLKEFGINIYEIKTLDLNEAE